MWWGWTYWNTSLTPARLYQQPPWTSKDLSMHHSTYSFYISITSQFHHDTKEVPLRGFWVLWHVCQQITTAESVRHKPSRDIPASRHFAKRQYRQEFRVFALITQLESFLHENDGCSVKARRKNFCKIYKTQNKLTWNNCKTHWWCNSHFDFNLCNTINES